MRIVSVSSYYFIISVLQPLNFKYNELEQKAERLSDFIGGMEEREEQLKQKVLEVEMYWMVEVESVKEKEQMMLVKDQKYETGRKVKNTLLLTAAFGAVHQAITHEIVVNWLQI